MTAEFRQTLADTVERAVSDAFLDHLDDEITAALRKVLPDVMREVLPSVLRGMQALPLPLSDRRL